MPSKLETLKAQMEVLQAEIAKEEAITIVKRKKKPFKTPKLKAKVPKIPIKKKPLKQLIELGFEPKIKLKMKHQKATHKVKHGTEIADYVIGAPKMTTVAGNIHTLTYHVDFYPMTESTSLEIAKFIQRCMNEAQTKTNAKNAIMKAQAKYADLEQSFYGTITVDKSLTKEQIEVKVLQKANKQYPTVDYLVYITEVQVLISPLSDAGGCSDEKCKSETILIDEDHKFIIRSYKAKNNNCLIQCFNVGYSVNGQTHKPDTTRKNLDIPLGTLIPYGMVPKISEYFNKKFNQSKGYAVWNQANQVIISGGKQDDRIDLYLRDDHYYLMENVDYKNCPDCARKLRTDNVDHVCDASRVSYQNIVQKKKRDLVKVQRAKKEVKLDYDNKLVIWDLETFQEKFRHVPYACGWLHQQQYKVTYGEDCMESFIDEILTYEDVMICAYNGSAFDFHFLIDKLTQRGEDINNLIKNNGRTLSFEFGKGNKIFDLCLFTSSSLDKACDDYKIVNSKGKFDHALMKTWSDTETYKSTVLPYLETDVRALDELMRVFNNMIFDKFEVNITKFLTVSSMGYEIWASKLKNTIEIPQEIEKYDFIMKAKYGGRTTCHQKKWESQTWTKLDKTDMNLAYKKLLKSGDYLFNGDVSSQYPASMAGCRVMKVEYPTGRSRWSLEPEKEFKDGKLGFYEVEFTCPDNLRVPVIPKKKTKHGAIVGVDWDLLAGKGVYTSVDIENGIDAGYQVKFINKCLVYDSKSSTVFKDYIESFFQMKNEADKLGLPVQRSIAKLFMNSLYGKMLQKAIFSQNAIINNNSEFNRFCADNDVTDWKELNGSGKLIVTGESLNKEVRIRKPSQLGCFVTAYSRRLMLVYMKAIDPTLTSMIFTYTDTDSLHMSGASHQKLLKMGYIQDSSNAELGMLTNDIKKDGLIVKEINLAPKSYRYDYINAEGVWKCGDNGTMKYKGIQGKNNRAEYYDLDQPVVLKNSGLKKKATTLSKKDKAEGIGYFSICNYEQDRTFNKNPWHPENFLDNQWYPTGHKQLNGKKCVVKLYEPTESKNHTRCLL